MTRHQPVRAVLLVLGGGLIFACMDIMTKYLAGLYPAPVVVAIRYIVHCLLMLGLLAPSQGRQLVQTGRPGLVVLRAACLALASLFIAFALQRMPVAEMTAIVFLAPMLVVLLAGPFLNERVTWSDWLAAFAGFAGVLLIAHPGGRVDLVGVGLALLSVALMAVYQLLSRVLTRTERTVTLLFHTALVGAVVFGLTLPWFWTGQSPTTLELALFLAIGLLGGIGHFMFTSAHRYAPVSALAPLQYVQLLYAGLLGWIVFDHVPERLAVLGMCIVAVSGAMVALRSRLAARTLEEVSEA